MHVISMLGGSSMFGAAATTPAKRLQAAIASLGKVTGSAKLKIAVDGAIGPKTVTAVNWAFTQHIGPGQAPAELRTGKMTLAFIKGSAATLAGLVEDEIKRRGGTAAKPATVTKATAIKAINTATPAAASSKADVKRLQQAIVNLGKVSGSAKLKIAVDGAAGPKTVAAVNWAFTQHIGSGQAPADVRTGALDLAYVKSHALTLATLVEAEVQRRGGVPKATAKPKAVAKAAPVAVKTKTGKVVKATKVATASGETYKVENEGETYYTPDPTVTPPPKKPAALPAPTAEQEEVAAEASAAQASAGRTTVISPSQISPEEAAASYPGGGGESFFSQYTWPIIGGAGALVLIGIGAVVLKNKQPQQQQLQPQQPRTVTP